MEHQTERQKLYAIEAPTKEIGELVDRATAVNWSLREANYESCLSDLNRALHALNNLGQQGRRYKVLVLKRLGKLHGLMVIWAAHR